MSREQKDLLVPPAAGNRLAFDTSVVGHRLVSIENVGHSPVTVRVLLSRDGISFDRSSRAKSVGPGEPLVVRLPPAPYASLRFRSRRGSVVRASWNFIAGACG